MITNFQSNKRLQQRVALGAFALVLIGLFALAPVRAIASDFLSIFRVQQFVLVDVDEARMEEIASAIGDNVLGEFESVSDGGAPVDVASVDEAASQAGFIPQTISSYGAPTAVAFTSGSTMRFTPNLAGMQMVFGNLGLDPALLPAEIDGQAFDITLYPGVIQTFGDAENQTVLFQTPAPTTDVPAGVDMSELGKAMLLLFGMSEDEAARLSESIDWTTTLVLPVPTENLEAIQEVQVSGKTGLAFNGEGVWDQETQSYRPAQNTLIWQDSGYLYMLSGPGDLLNIANNELN